tara:strand:+ start:3944 stop:4720 length:777 start_codon:yes stop_codon:yes gene_type:complete
MYNYRKMVETFTKERTKICEDLMLPEIRPLLDLSLDEKIERSKDIIRDAVERYQKIGLGFSGGTDSLVLLHLVLQIKKDIPCVCVDTQHEFPETYDFVSKVVVDWDVKDFQKVRAHRKRTDEFSEKFGFKTPEFAVAYDGYHKIAPMMKVIRDRGFDAFFVGLRGVEHEERAKEIFFSVRQSPDHMRVHPLLFWRQEDIMEYVRKFNIECHPLYAQGYTSLGCTIFSEKNTDPNAHERAGRGVVREEVMAKLRALGYT